MFDYRQKIIGILFGLACLSMGLLPRAGSFFVCIPVFFIAPFSFAFPISAVWFLIIYILGLTIGHLFFQCYGQNWVWPEIIAILTLFWVPTSIRKLQESIRTKFETDYGIKQREFEASREAAEQIKKQNIAFEMKLRQVEHLYDVIKEAGTTLNVQEMIELAKEFTERMFDLPHFIIAVLSEDGKKY